MPHTVLVIGLDPRRVPGPWDPAPVVEAIEAGMTALADAGYDAEACLVGLDGSDDVEARIADALRSRTWDCVLVGGGIRTSEDQLELFETTLDLVRRLAPAAPIAFNRSPRDLVEAVARSLSTTAAPGGGVEVSALAINVTIPEPLRWTDTRRGEEFTLTTLNVRMLPDHHLAAKAYGRPTGGGRGAYVSFPVPDRPELVALVEQAATRAAETWSAHRGLG